jgi:ketosteroid isomerase-like protein
MGGIQMTAASELNPDQIHVRQILERWADTTRQSLLDEVLANHHPDCLIYDVLPPMKYENTDSYRRSWGDWQPNTQGEEEFALHDLKVVVDPNIAFAHCTIRCGGILSNGKPFEDLVRGTFCLQKFNGAWKVTHQHISKPFHPGGGK